MKGPLQATDLEMGPGRLTERDQVLETEKDLLREKDPLKVGDLETAMDQPRENYLATATDLETDLDRLKGSDLVRVKGLAKELVWGSEL